MTVTTDASVTIDDNEMCTPAFNITMLDDLENMFPMGKRGSNIVIGGAQGELWRPKMYAPAQRTLHMWVCWKDEDGGSAATREARWGQFQLNLDNLKSYLGDSRIQHAFAKYFYQSDGSLALRTFWGEVVDAIPMVFAENDYYPSAEFDLVVQSADPFWYGEPIENGLSGGTNVIDFGGNVFTSKITALFDGGTDASLTNTTNGVVMGLTGTPSAGLVDVKAFTAIDVSSANIVGNVTHSGAREFMVVDPGINSLDFAGGGTLDLTVWPAYL